MILALSIIGSQAHSFALRRLIYLGARLFQRIHNDLLHLTVSGLRTLGQLQEWKGSLTHQMVSKFIWGLVHQLSGQWALRDLKVNVQAHWDSSVFQSREAFHLRNSNQGASRPRKWQIPICKKFREPLSLQFTILTPIITKNFGDCFYKMKTWWPTSTRLRSKITKCCARSSTSKTSMRTHWCHRSWPSRTNSCTD